MGNKKVIDWVKSEVSYIDDGYAHVNLVIEDITMDFKVDIVEDWSYEEEYDYFHYVLYGYTGKDKDNRMHIGLVVDDSGTNITMIKDGLEVLRIEDIYNLDGIRLVECIKRCTRAKENLLQDD